MMRGAAAEHPALFDVPAADEVPGQLPGDPGAVVVVRSHTRHLRQGIEKRNAKKPRRTKESLQVRFKRYHDANPQVYRRLVSMARELRKKGVQHYGIAALWEVLRYESITATRTEAEPFKMNNSHRAYYARLIHDQEQDLAGFFRTRALR